MTIVTASRRFPRRLASRLLFATALMAAASAAHAAEPLAGRAIADRWCASCHVVGEDQQKAQSDAPSFAAIAARGNGPSAEWLAFRLLTPHPQMPQVSLTRTEAADLAAYIGSLRK